MNKMICQICSREFHSKTTLMIHIKKNHNFKKYYDLYLKKENEGKCAICENETEFLNRFENSYKITCSKKCRSIQILKEREKTWLKKYGVSHPHKIKEIRDKKKKTCKEKYDNENYVNMDKQISTNI